MYKFWFEIYVNEINIYMCTYNDNEIYAYLYRCRVYFQYTTKKFILYDENEI